MSINAAKQFEDSNPDVKFLMVDKAELTILEDAIFSLTLRHPGYGNDKKAHELLERITLKLKKMENESEDRT